MGKLLAGLVFLLFDLRLRLGGSTVGLLPSFAGYFELSRGLRELHGDSAVLEKLRIPVLVLGLYELILYILRLTGTPAPDGTADRLLSAVSASGILFTTHRLTDGIREIEARFAFPPAEKSLSAAWCGLTAAYIAAFCLQHTSVWSILAGIAAFGAGLCFLLRFDGARRRYLACRPPRR